MQTRYAIMIGIHGIRRAVRPVPCALLRYAVPPGRHGLRPACTWPTKTDAMLLGLSNNIRIPPEEGGMKKVAAMHNLASALKNANRVRSL